MKSNFQEIFKFRVKIRKKVTKSKIIFRIYNEKIVCRKHPVELNAYKRYVKSDPKKIKKWKFYDRTKFRENRPLYMMKKI